MVSKNYKHLISAERRRKSSVQEKRDINQESESDRGRFVFSSPLRRLQQKAQVYSLEDNAAVRSRLTHSLEVSQLGRHIAQQVLQKLNSTEQKPEGHDIAFVNFVETACLMHDVGNPPFGHLGEYAIQEWFSNEAERCIEKAGIVSANCTEEMKMYLSEFKRFDGNCQGFRIVTRLQWNNDEYGLNLTYTQLASYLKYVTHQSKVNNEEIKKKGGYFWTEEEIVKECWKELGMDENTRHPLVYIMEAADDIAYSISDIEDALEKELIHLGKFLASVKSTIEISGQSETEFAKNVLEIVKQTNGYMDDDHLSPFTDFRTGLTRLLSSYAADQYVSNHDKILNGSFPPIFSNKSNIIQVQVLEGIKKFAIDNVYKTAAASDNELAGYSILQGLLNHFKPLLSCKRIVFNHLCSVPDLKGTMPIKPNMLQKRLFALLPKRYVKVYITETQKLDNNDDLSDLKEWVHRAHLITDYVSGMTDDYALESFQLLSGIKVGRTNLTK